ncbi:MAG: type IV pilus secretin PilQ [Chitinivibrionales bacterium]|nr:type IV pilus secretin PilQ [Chitinivibrionales bacterium]
MTHAQNDESGGPDAQGIEAPVIAEWKWHNADVRSVFKQLSTISGVDIVMADDVTGKISLTVTNKTWKDVFSIICKIRNLAAIKEDGYLYVLSQDEYQKQRLAEASNAQAAEQVAPLTREVVRLDNMTAEEMATSAQELLSSRGKITVVNHNNSLIVYDTEENIRQIAQMIEKLDVETEQISISAKIIEVSSGAMQNMGIQWGAFGDAGGTEISAEHLPGENLIVNALDRLTYGVISQDRLAVTLEYLFEDNRGEIVAQPQITTVDNKEARLFMGQQVPVRYLDEAGNTVIRMIDAGTELIVTPHVTGEGRVLLSLVPKKKSYEATNQGPIINEQSASTNVVVNDGETVVIAGLTSNEQQESEGGIPVLKDIPLIGNLFKRSQKTNSKKDLIIFVTPYIIQKNIESVSVEENAEAIE